jgi:hypothetical protein
MLKIGTRVAIDNVPLITFLVAVALALLQSHSNGDMALAPTDGDACRKEICDAAVEACMRADLSLNPFASTGAKKKKYCAQFPRLHD